MYVHPSLINSSFFLGKTRKSDNFTDEEFNYWEYNLKILDDEMKYFPKTEMKYLSRKNRVYLDYTHNFFF